MCLLQVENNLQGKINADNPVMSPDLTAVPLLPTLGEANPERSPDPKAVPPLPTLDEANPVMPPFLEGALKKFNLGALVGYPGPVMLKCTRWCHRIT